MQEETMKAIIDKLKAEERVRELIGEEQFMELSREHDLQVLKLLAEILVDIFIEQEDRREE